MTGGPWLRDPLAFRGRVELWSFESEALEGIGNINWIKFSR